MPTPIIYVRTALSSLIQIQKIISVLYFTVQKSYDSDQMEQHPFWEMVYVTEGSLLAFGGDAAYSLYAGDILFHKPDEPHMLHGDGVNPSQFFIIAFDCHSSTMEFFRNFSSPLTLEQKSLMNKLIWEARQTFIPANYPGVVSLARRPEAPLGGEQLVQNLLEMILLLLMREKNETGEALFLEGATAENKITEEIVRFLQEHVHGRITLDEVCKSLTYQKTYLCTLFKKQTGRTILQYYTILKIAESKRLIRETGWSFSEIAENLAFGSPYYFSQTFRRVVGLSPREYRKSLLPLASPGPHSK